MSPWSVLLLQSQLNPETNNNPQATTNRICTPLAEVHSQKNLFEVLCLKKVFQAPLSKESSNVHHDILLVNLPHSLNFSCVKTFRSHRFSNSLLQHTNPTYRLPTIFNMCINVSNLLCGMICFKRCPIQQRSAVMGAVVKGGKIKHLRSHLIISHRLSQAFLVLFKLKVCQNNPQISPFTNPSKIFIIRYSSSIR